MKKLLSILALMTLQLSTSVVSANEPSFEDMSMQMCCKPTVSGGEAKAGTLLWGSSIKANKGQANVTNINDNNKATNPLSVKGDTTVIGSPPNTPPLVGNQE